VDLNITAAGGHDTVILNHVAGGTDKSAFPTSQFTVQMGPGHFDSLTVLSCSGDQAVFRDTAGDGALVRSNNHFISETDSGFSLII
jgi:hypothetical protein